MKQGNCAIWPQLRRLVKSMTKSGMLLFFGILFLCCIHPVILGTEQPQDKLPPSPYYPLQVGNTWHYRDGKETLTVRVVAHEKVGGDLCAKMEATEKGTKRIEFISIKSDGLYRTKTKDKVLSPPLCFLQLPPKKEATWKVDSMVENINIKGTFKVEEEEITVPAGKYKTFRSACKNLGIGSRNMAVTYWFAKDVGIVKQRMEMGDVVINLELEKFEAGN